MKKVCRKCFTEKDEEEFSIRDKHTNKRRRNECRVCEAKQKREYYIQNQEKFIERSKKHYEENREQKIEYAKQHRKKEDKNKVNEYKRNWKKNNSEKMKESRKKDNKRIRERRKKDVVLDLRYKISSFINKSFRRVSTVKNKKTIEILGCDFEFFKHYLESKFDENMSWENRGSYWWIDHIIPLSTAKTIEDVVRLNHYTNLQPMYWLDNIRKSNKILN